MTSLCRSTQLSEPVYLAMAAHGISATKSTHSGRKIAFGEMMICFMILPFLGLWSAAGGASHADSNPVYSRHLWLGHHPDRTPQGLIGPVQRTEERTGLRSRSIRSWFKLQPFCADLDPHGLSWSDIDP